MQKYPVQQWRMPAMAWIAIVPFFLTIYSCEKLLDTAPDKLPAELQFEFAIQGYELLDDKSLPGQENQANQGRFSIGEGQLAIENIEFDGRRQHGAQQVYFISNFPTSFIVNLTPQHSTTDISFDIPQGNYNMIEITFHLGDDLLPSLVMEGSFQRGNHEPVPVRFEYNYREQIPVKAKQGGGQPTFVFEKDEVSRAMVQVDTESLLRLVNFGMLIHAEIAYIDGTEVLLINENTNHAIFNSISARLSNALTLVID